MRVIHITDTLRSGGKERQLVELLKGLINTPDVECELIIMSDDIHYSEVLDFGVKIHYIIRKSRKDPSVFLKLFKLLKERKPNILHSWNSMCSIYALPALKLLRIKFVNGFLRDVPPSFQFGEKLWIRSKLTFIFSDCIVSNSQAALQAYNVPFHKAVCIHNGFDFNRIANLPSVETIRKKYEIVTPFVVGMVASFTYKKDYYSIVDAAKIILGKRSDITFLFIGDGPTLGVMRKYVPERNQPFIKFLGKQKNVEQLSAIFNVGVLTTHGEGISNSIMEYMALSKPVVATDCAGNRELVKNRNTGFLIKVGDKNALVEKILMLLDKPTYARYLGVNGKSRLEAEFDMKKLTIRHLELYKKIW
jgi:glycosyltransferase involved in cell wall biosynthesis